MTDPEAPRPARRALLVLGFLGAAAAAGALVARPLLAEGIRRWAASQGLELRFSGLALRSGRLSLEQVTVTAAGFERLSLESPEATLHIERWRPQFLHFAVPRVRFAGTRADAVERWKALLGGPSGAPSPPRALGDLPLRYDAFEIVAQAPGDAHPWLAVRRLEVRPQGGSYAVAAEGLAAQGVELGAQRLSWTPTAAGGVVEFGERPGALPVKVAIEPRDGGLGLRVESKRFRLGPLVDLKLLPAEARKVEVEGVIDAVVPRDSIVDGTARVTLWGYTPPHPPDVSPLVASDRTSLQGSFHLDLAQSTLAVPAMSVTTGRLTLSGSGSGALRPGQPLEGASFRGHLTGSLPCRDVARASAARRVGGFAGDLLGDLADLAVRGNVQISVQIEADPKKPPSTYLQPTVTARCDAGL